MKRLPIEFPENERSGNKNLEDCRKKITAALSRVLKYCDNPEKFDEERASALLQEVRNEVLGGILAVERLKMAERRVEEIRKKKKRNKGGLGV